MQNPHMICFKVCREGMAGGGKTRTEVRCLGLSICLYSAWSRRQLELVLPSHMSIGGYIMRVCLHLSNAGDERYRLKNIERILKSKHACMHKFKLTLLSYTNRHGESLGPVQKASTYHTSSEELMVFSTNSEQLAQHDGRPEVLGTVNVKVGFESDIPRIPSPTRSIKCIIYSVQGGKVLKH